MAVFSRSKRVTDPLDDNAKARLIGSDHHHLQQQHQELSYVSSGSEHYDSSADSPCLFELVDGFLHDDDDRRQSPPPPTTATISYDSDSDLLESSAPDREINPIDEIIRSLNSSNNADSYRRLLLHHLSTSIDSFSLLRPDDRSAFLRSVMAFLRQLGHNAAICKTKWTSSGSSLASGSHDFLDVVRSPGGVRYFVELDLISEFEIARPTVQYSRMLQCLPRIFVGTAEELMKIVKVLCDGARRSLRSRDLVVSPWRKSRYVQNKWFAPYRRTVNSIPEKSSVAKATEGDGAAHRCVGFDDVVSDVNINRQFFVRTR